ncbi:MAG: aminoglycoside phosphotransferase [Ilumatobacteraceae bacterium]|nr:aminoglycoside phosphotransferase [Ilumatobacteraceae bacterium]
MDEAVLLRIVREHAGPTVELRGTPTPMQGGFWAAIFAFELDGAVSAWTGPLVLRVMPDPVGAARESIVQRMVAEQGFPTPSVLAAGNDAGIGGAFMIMRRAAGTSPVAGLDLGPREMLRLPGVLRRLPAQLAAVAQRLHALDPTPIREAFAAVDTTTAGDATAAADDSGSVPGGRHGIDARLRLIRGTAEVAGTDGFGDLADWLDRNRPSTSTEVVCHGDLHPFNLLVDDDGVVTVLDWTNANVVRREFDLGFTSGLLRCAPVDLPGFLRPVGARATRWLADDFLRRYGRSAVDTSAVRWFEVLQWARCLAEVASARAGLSDTVGTEHPFETSAASMTLQVRRATNVDIRLPTR